MSIEVTHPDTLTPTNKLNNILYAHQHIVNANIETSDMESTLQTLLSNVQTLVTALSGKTIRVPVLVSTTTLTNDYTKTITGLDGQNDKEYLIVIEVQSSSTATTLQIEYNGDTTSGNYETYTHIQEVDIYNSHNKNWTSTRTIGRIYTTAPYKSKFEGTIHCGTQNYVLLMGFCKIIGVGMMQATERWYNSSGGYLSSLRLYTSSSSELISGTVKIYKMVDLSL